MVPIPLSLKAATATKAEGCERASISIEAAVSISIFIFSFLILLSPMIAIRQHIHAAVLMEERVRELSRLKYLEYYGEDGRIPLDRELLSGVGTAFTLYSLQSGISSSGLSVSDIISESHIDNENIKLVYNYRLFSPFPFLTDKSLSKQVVAERRGWIGAEPYRFSELSEACGDEDMVYIGSRSENVYHKSRECSYLRSRFLSSSYTGIKGLRNRFGDRYMPCRSCRPGSQNGEVYYTEGGKRYHSSAACPAMQSHPIAITEQQAIAEGRHLCHRCAV